MSAQLSRATGSRSPPSVNVGLDVPSGAPPRPATPQKTYMKNYNLLKKLISIQSTSDNPEEKLEILDLIKKHFSESLIIKEYKFENRTALVLGNTKSKNVDLIIASHADVVEADKLQFNLFEDGDKLLGRGVFDMKAVMLASIQTISKIDPKIRVAIFVTTDEEIDGLTTKYLLEKAKYKAKFAIIPDGGEETGISVEQKGFMQIHINFKGESAHASEPWNAKNPIDMGLIFSQKLKEKFSSPKNHKDWKTSIALTKIESGVSLNQIPKHADFYFDIRYIYGDNPKDIIEKIKKILPVGAKIKIVAQNKPFLVSKNNPHLDILTNSIKKISGKNVSFLRDCSTSDAVFFMENNIPAVLFRPTGGNPHNDGEWISKKSLEHFETILTDFISNFSKL